MEKSNSFIAIPPGMTIKEQIKDRGISQKEFAVRMGMSQKHISRLINGEVQLTIDMARRLEMVLGIPAQFWCNLESIYREKLAKNNEENTLGHDIDFVKKFPYEEMAEEGWVEKTSKQIERVVNLRKYFEVYQLSLIKEHLIPDEIRCRRLLETEKSYYVLLAWAQKAKLEGRDVETRPININRLIKSISNIRKMTVMSPKEFCPKLKNILSECGIAIVFLPYIDSSFANGVTFYEGKKIILGLTLKEKDIDKFWISLFHEIGHIVLGHIDNPQGVKEEEKDADDYSENVLIPRNDFDIFVNSNNISEREIIEFAQKEEIDVGIVLARLQKYKYLDNNKYNILKKKIC